jgi:hypothetical protein
MLKNILKYVEGLKEVDFNPESKNRFSNILVQDWRIKGNYRIDAVVCKNSVFSRAKISTSAIITNSLLIDCELRSLLSLAPVVSFKRGVIYSSLGRIDVIDRSHVENSELEIIGNCYNTTFVNCKLTKGDYVSCKFINCEISDGTVMLSEADTPTFEKSKSTKFNSTAIII